MVDNQQKDYFKSLTQRDDGSISLPVVDSAFQAAPVTGERSLTRRDFLAAAGFTFGGVAMTGCNRAPVEKAIPYLVQPEAIIPGRATYYASTCGACSAGCGLIVKNRDGRVIKLEGNPDHPNSRGGLCAVGQASVLGLYDAKRMQSPQLKNVNSTWDAIDGDISARLEAIRQSGGAVRFLTGPVTSPTTRGMIDAFMGSFDDARHVTYETLSMSAIHGAYERTHGARVLPRYDFGKADVIVSFDADFLGTWISPVSFSAGWREGRNADAPRFSHHTQFEGRMSITGAKADQRICIAPGEHGLMISHLASLIAKRAGVSFDTAGMAACPIDVHVLEALADRLWHARGKSLVVCGSQNIDAQMLCNFINHHLGSYGATIDIQHPARQGDDGDDGVQNLMQEMAAGSVGALFLNGVNPVYDLPNGADFALALEKVETVVSFSDRQDETSAKATYHCPDHHYLESWGDVDAGDDTIAFLQPAMRPLFDTRSVLESLSIWSGKNQSAQTIVRETWAGRISWDKAIHDGLAKVRTEAASVGAFQAGSVKAIVAAAPVPEGTLALELYAKASMLDGRCASNPWLHEMPDPISKVTWDNYACLSEATAKRLGLATGDVIDIKPTAKAGAAKGIALPVLVQPGQHDEVIAIAVGYGRQESARFADVGPEWLERRSLLGDNGLVGTSAASLLTYHDGTLRLSGAAVSVSRTGRTHDLACTQDYHNIEVPEELTVPGMERRRPLIKETSLAAYKKDGTLGHDGHAGHHDMGELWPEDHTYAGHHWGMAIDLTTCTGCSACVIACQVENNVPVVGRDEVRRKRTLHWMRIDRYYCDNDGTLDVAHQPMMCHHCDHAPCETVCPVLATVHGEEGLNQQIYNRCVGTRYCANNCPYKVRRFNWFEYARDDTLANMSLNPDVTVRSRGVMEKCSFCVQRIEVARMEAKREGRPIADGDVLPACQQSCPSRAIVFGDMNDSDSAVSKLIASGRHYRLLEETNVRPSVGYLGMVRNREAKEDRTHHG